MPAHLIGEGLVLNLENGTEWVVGRDPEFAVFVIEDPAVSRKHALLTKQPEGVFLQNLSDTKSIYINGIEYESGNHDRVLLKEGDQIQIGSHTFRYSDEEIPAGAETKKDAYDDIFGDLDEPTEPPPPPRVEKPKEMSVEESLNDTSEPELTPKQEDSLFDTVFEDLETDAEIPLNLLQPTTLMLKIISGPNAGEEIGIEKGRTYVIGRDPNTCSILLHDYSVSQSHAKLSVSVEDTMELEDLGSKNGVLVNGQKINEKTAITPEDLISLGTTVLIIIDRSKEQKTIYSAVVHHAAISEPAEIQELVAHALAVVPEEEDWKKKPIPMKHLVMAGSFLAIIFIVFITFFSLFKSSQVTETQKEPAARIKEALSKYSDVQSSFNPATGKLFLVGHVETNVDYQEMLYRLNEVGFIQSLDNNVVIDELVLKSTNDILSNNPDWRGVSIRSKSAGKFEAVGYVQTSAQALALSDFLTVNFPYLDRLQNDVAAEDVLSAQVQSHLMHDFGSVTFQLSGNELTLSGNYSNKKSSEFAKLVKTLNTIPGISRVHNYASPVAPSATGINITQNYQVTGSSSTDGHGYSVVLNGKIYSVGDSVDGMAITSIESKTILLEKDGIKYKIDYR